MLWNSLCGWEKKTNTKFTQIYINLIHLSWNDFCSEIGNISMRALDGKNMLF